MRSPWKWLKRRWELARQAPPQGRSRSPAVCTLRPSRDARSGQREGRIRRDLPRRTCGTASGGRAYHSDFKTISDPIGPLDPGVPLGPPERLEREWAAYSELYPLGLAPQPLWRSTDSIACAWVPWGRVSDALREQPNRVWEMLERTLPAVAQMHAREWSTSI